MLRNLVRSCDKEAHLGHVVLYGIKLGLRDRGGGGGGDADCVSPAV